MAVAVSSWKTRPGTSKCRVRSGPSALTRSATHRGGAGQAVASDTMNRASRPKSVGIGGGWKRARSSSWALTTRPWLLSRSPTPRNRRCHYRLRSGARRWPFRQPTAVSGRCLNTGPSDRRLGRWFNPATRPCTTDRPAGRCQNRSSGWSPGPAAPVPRPDWCRPGGWQTAHGTRSAGGGNQGSAMSSWAVRSDHRRAKYGGGCAAADARPRAVRARLASIARERSCIWTPVQAGCDATPAVLFCARGADRRRRTASRGGSYLACLTPISVVGKVNLPGTVPRCCDSPRSRPSSLPADEMSLGPARPSDLRRLEGWIENVLAA